MAKNIYISQTISWRCTFVNDVTPQDHHSPDTFLKKISYYIFMKVFQHLAQGVIEERPIFCNNSSRNEVNIDDAAIV